MDRPYPRIDTYAWVALALTAALVALYPLGLDLAWAATVVPGGAERLGDGIKDAAKTAEIGLIGYLGPIASVAAGLITALATRQAGGSNAGAAASGVAAAGIVAFIPVAGTTTYTTSGSAAADFGSLIGASGATPVNRDLFALLTIMLFFAAITWLRHARARHAR